MDKIRIVREKKELKFEIKERKRKIAEFEFQYMQTPYNGIVY